MATKLAAPQAGATVGDLLDDADSDQAPIETDEIPDEVAAIDDLVDTDLSHYEAVCPISGERTSYEISKLSGATHRISKNNIVPDNIQTPDVAHIEAKKVPEAEELRKWLASKKANNHRGRQRLRGLLREYGELQKVDGEGAVAWSRLLRRDMVGTLNKLRVLNEDESVARLERIDRIFNTTCLNLKSGSTVRISSDLISALSAIIEDPVLLEALNDSEGDFVISQSVLRSLRTGSISVRDAFGLVFSRHHIPLTATTRGTPGSLRIQTIGTPQAVFTFMTRELPRVPKPLILNHSYKAGDLFNLEDTHIDNLVANITTGKEIAIALLKKASGTTGISSTQMTQARAETLENPKQCADHVERTLDVLHMMFRLSNSGICAKRVGRNIVFVVANPNKLHIFLESMQRQSIDIEKEETEGTEDD